MAIEVSGAGHTLLYAALAQNDVDMQHHKLLNLDTSNLEELGSPPTITLPQNQWLHGWNNSTHIWSASRPQFVDIAGVLTTGVGGQQRAITELGTINTGTWQGNIISGTYLATLNQIRPPLADVNMNSRKLINLANPINAQDAVTKSFMDYLLQGVNPKAAVRVASTVQTSHVDMRTPIDGVTLNSGDRVLLKDQFRPLENGIWIAGNGPWTLAPDADTFDEYNRLYCTVREGTANASTSWVQVNPQTAEGQDRGFILFGVLGASGEPGLPGVGVPPGGLADDVLVKNSEDDYDTKWVTVPGISTPEYAILQTAASAILPGNTSTTIGKMMGLAGLITPLSTGKIAGTVNGYIFNNNAAGGTIATIRIGSGAAPHNGDPPPVGSTFIGGVTATNRLAQNAIVPFSMSFVTDGLAIGQTIWIDVVVLAVTTGTASVGAVAIAAYELP